MKQVILKDQPVVIVVSREVIHEDSEQVSSFVKVTSINDTFYQVSVTSHSFELTVTQWTTSLGVHRRA